MGPRELSGDECLVRVVTKKKDIDEKSGTLSVEAIMISDLDGIGKDGRPRSLSTSILCRCCNCQLEATIAELRRDEALPSDPGAGHATMDTILRILSGSGPAFKISVDAGSIPHHASVVFAATSLKPAEKKALRHRLIAAFGKVQPVWELHTERCVS